MKISYRLDYVEASANAPNGSWTLYRLVEGKPSRPAGLGPTRHAPAPEEQSGFVGRGSTLRYIMHEIAQDKARWSEPPWQE